MLRYARCAIIVSMQQMRKNNMDKTNSDYIAGYSAFKAGLALSDKPDLYRFGNWEIGWHDAHAELTRSITHTRSITQRSNNDG